MLNLSTLSKIYFIPSARAIFMKDDFLRRATVARYYIWTIF